MRLRIGAILFSIVAIGECSVGTFAVEVVFICVSKGSYKGNTHLVS